MTAKPLTTGHPTTGGPAASGPAASGPAISGPAISGEAGPGTERAAVEERILRDVVAMLHDVIGDEYVIDREIGLSTSFDTDLELESIEFVALADRMRQRYGDTVDFVGFLADRTVDEVINMRVGEVVSFIADCLTSPQPAQPSQSPQSSQSAQPAQSSRSWA
ncbi:MULTISPECIES: phosphopantetheine-binding protein [unclassified Frankia]|uniref:phosphopantetheine-binding protein n=1 Tax=unclassified Frankia TaxID=2632575 RepID=UPI004043A55B